MRVWRICKEAYAVSAFSGVGAEEYGGRWNRKGDRLVCASTSLSLAALELFVHLAPDQLPDDLRAVSATIPDGASFQELTIADLPTNWRDYPAPSSLQKLGSNWLRELRTLALSVPSAVNPDEKNVLLNPNHPEARAMFDVQTKPFQFDPRMWK